MGKLCVIYNFAQKYREGIFREIDKEWDCEWIFGKAFGGIKEMDVTQLKHATQVKRVNLPYGFTWQKGVLNRLLGKEPNSFLMLGDLFSASTWTMLLLRPFVAPKKRIYLWSHGWYGREGLGKRWMKRWFFGLATKTFLYGNYAKTVAAAQRNDARKLHVIHNSLDYNYQASLRAGVQSSDIYTSHFGNARKTLLFIGRLTHVKRLDEVIRAIHLLKKKGEAYNLVLVGSGEDEQELKHLAVDSDVPVWFFGECYDDKVNCELIYNADLCVSPGNVGLTAMHTMMFGTPVISHDNFTNQMPEFEAIKPGVTGDFFKEGNVESLANAISRWFERNGDRREAVRQACYREIDESWNPEFQMMVFRKHIIV